jgi:hypothetical protein
MKMRLAVGSSASSKRGRPVMPRLVSSIAPTEREGARELSGGPVLSGCNDASLGKADEKADMNIPDGWTINKNDEATTMLPQPQ